jgi:hypothetical protein
MVRDRIELPIWGQAWQIEGWIFWVNQLESTHDSWPISALGCWKLPGVWGWSVEKIRELLISEYLGPVRAILDSFTWKYCFCASAILNSSSGLGGSVLSSRTQMISQGDLYQSKFIQSGVYNWRLPCLDGKSASKQIVAAPSHERLVELVT